MKRLAIVTTHPVQYNAPWFKLLNERGVVNTKIFYTWSQSQQGPKYDPDFKKVVEWDIPLLEGYEYEFVDNISKEPGSHHFKGINNPSLKEKISAWKPDALLVIGWSYKSHLGCLRYFKGKIPVLFRGDSTLLDETKGLKTFIRRIALRWVYKHVDKAIYVGTNNKAYFKAHGLKDHQLIPAWHTIDNERFYRLNETQLRAVENFQKDLGITKNDFVILFAGKMEEKKNPFFLLELSRKIKDPEVLFLLTGNGQLEENLKSQATGDNRVKFMNFQNQSLMPSVYALGSVFILPSNGPGETWGLGANEAMASGLPVILSSKAGGAVDLVKNNGLIFAPGEVEKVADFIQELKNSPGKLQQLKEASLQHIENFNFKQLATAIEKACGA